MKIDGSGRSNRSQGTPNPAILRRDFDIGGNGVKMNESAGGDEVFRAGKLSPVKVL
jgi:hypothetical protein